MKNTTYGKVSEGDTILLDTAMVKHNGLRHYIQLIVFCLMLFVLASCSFSTSNVDADEIAKEGYDAGYEDGFSFGGSFDMEDARTSFSLMYEAPKTPEEKEKFKIYVENYKRGFTDGKKNR